MGSGSYPSDDFIGKPFISTRFSGGKVFYVVRNLKRPKVFNTPEEAERYVERMEDEYKERSRHEKRRK